MILGQYPLADLDFRKPPCLICVLEEDAAKAFQQAHEEWQRVRKAKGRSFFGPRKAWYAQMENLARWRVEVLRTDLERLTEHKHGSTW